MGIAALAAIGGRTALAEEAEHGWSFEVTPYLFAASMDGTSGVRGVEAKVDMDFDDILDNLDSAFMAQFEAHRGRWGFGVEGIYFRLENRRVDDWSGPLGNDNVAELNWTAAEHVYQATVSYRVLSEQTKLDVLAAARYTEVDGKLALALTTGSPLLPNGTRAASRNENWVDPVVGARLLTPLSASWSMLAYADVGGLGAGSDLTYQLFAALRWQFAEQVSLQAGYRYVYQDYEKGDFKWDMATSGPQLGLAFQW